ncbi:MAG: hypothetical protein F083_3163 [bacterium F083]|nr:MAG: hypothetical protein F083_3163 [bacterium F083]
MQLVGGVDVLAVGAAVEGVEKGGCRGAVAHLDGRAFDGAVVVGHVTGGGGGGDPGAVVVAADGTQVEVVSGGPLQTGEGLDEGVGLGEGDLVGSLEGGGVKLGG